MRTLFLLGILGALIIIATKKDNQTAMEAAMEMGQQAKSLVEEYDKAKVMNKALEKVEEQRKTFTKKVDPFINKTKEAITKASENLPRRLPEPEPRMKAKKVEPPVAPIREVKENPPADMSDWTMPQPRQLAMPDIPAMPKASVEKLDLETKTTVKVASVEPAAIDIGRSYDLVKGYYENASRLLEEIK
jgi:hypothetical protein